MEFLTGLTATGYAVGIYANAVTAHVNLPDGQRVTVSGATARECRVRVAALPGPYAAECARDLRRYARRYGASQTVQATIRAEAATAPDPVLRLTQPPLWRAEV